jgi:hypothetical protein
MEILLTAVIVSIIAPTVSVIVAHLVKRSDRREDWRRQDAVAEQAHQFSMTLLQAQEAQTVRLLASNAGVADKMGEVHALVNSDKTEGLERELAAAEDRLLLLQELGRPLEAVAVTRARIDELKVTIAARKEQQAAIDQANAQAQNETRYL